MTGMKTEKAIKWEMKGSREAGWREASGRREERRKNGQGKEPKAFQENSQGMDPSTPEGNSQGRDLRTFQEPVERWRVQKKSERKRSGRKREKETEEEGEAQKKKLVEKYKGKMVSLFMAGRKEEEKEKEGVKKNRSPRVRQVLRKSGRWLFLLLLLGQNWLCVNAAVEGLQRRAEMMERLQQQEVQVKESRWVKEIPQRWRQSKGEDRTEMRKKEIEVHLAQWIGMEYREEVQKKIQRHV